MQLRDYQRIGADFLAKRPYALLADEMGIGKTAQACTAINETLLPGERALIICPASLKVNWFRELAMWAPRLKVAIVPPGKVPFPRHSDVVIINYDLLKKHHNSIRFYTWEIVCCDEAHYLKNLESIRCKEVRGGFGVSPIPCSTKWALTGTPIENRPVELYALLKWFRAPGFGQSLNDYGVRYCGAFHDGFQWVYRGASNLDELRTKLEPFTLRRLKKDVLTELPPKIRQIVELEPDAKARKALAKEKQVVQVYGDAIKKMKFTGLSAKSMGEIAQARKETALAKLDAAIDYIKGELEEVDKIVVFAYHTEVIDKLMTALAKYGAVRLTGETSQKARQDAVDRFQKDTNVRVFVGNIIAAGTGITLTAASLTVFVEESWVPGQIMQAEDRTHRIGQKDCVVIKHLILAGSIDGMMLNSQAVKQEVIDKVFN